MEEEIDMILGMDIWVFTAWIGTILAAILCLIYGIYNWILKKTDKKKQSKRKNKQSRKKGD
jgi:F0F1-type ATP synthase assembly protein I